MQGQQNPNEPGKSGAPGQQGGQQGDRERQERERQQREKQGGGGGQQGGGQQGGGQRGGGQQSGRSTWLLSELVNGGRQPPPFCLTTVSQSTGSCHTSIAAADTRVRVVICSSLSAEP